MGKIRMELGTSGLAGESKDPTCSLAHSIWVQSSIVHTSFWYLRLNIKWNCPRQSRSPNSMLRCYKCAICSWSGLWEGRGRAWGHWGLTGLSVSTPKKLYLLCSLHREGLLAFPYTLTLGLQPNRVNISLWACIIETGAKTHGWALYCLCQKFYIRAKK